MDLLEFASQSREIGAEDGDAFVAFADWAPDEIHSLRGLGHTERFEPGAEVVAPDSDDRDLFIVVDGELEVYRPSGGVETRVAELGSSDVFGEIAFVAGGRRSARIVARTLARVVRISPGDLDDLAGRDPRLALRFLGEVARILADRLRHAYLA
jgi:CRP-like cAMP-binding protein